MSEQNFGNVTLRPDGSFVIERNGLPYHVPDNEEFHDLFLKVAAYAAAHPEMVTPEPPPLEPDPPTAEELEAQFDAAVTARVEAFARKRGWDSLDRVGWQRGAYAGDAEAVNAAYDATWAAALPMVEDVKAGIVSVDNAVAKLPALMWPE
jgi:hypothetical protein